MPSRLGARLGVSWPADRPQNQQQALLTAEPPLQPQTHVLICLIPQHSWHSFTNTPHAYHKMNKVHHLSLVPRWLHPSLTLHCVRRLFPKYFECILCFCPYPSGWLQYSCGIYLSSFVPVYGQSGVSFPPCHVLILFFGREDTGMLLKKSNLSHAKSHITPSRAVPSCLSDKPSPLLFPGLPFPWLCGSNKRRVCFAFLSYVKDTLLRVPSCPWNTFI